MTVIFELSGMATCVSGLAVDAVVGISHLTDENAVTITITLTPLPSTELCIRAKQPTLFGLD